MQTEQVKTNGTNGHAHVRPELVALDLDNVDANPNNPRKTFTAIDDLASSIVAHGLLEPIIVRPKGKRYELVCGERRWRASKQAKVTTILALVRELEDKQCEILMVEENTKRSDLHPLEEAEGYERLRKVHGMTVEEIAATVSKTPATVYARMKLCALCKKGREACYAGTITPSVALYIARIPNEKLQLEALKELEDFAKRGERAEGQAYSIEERRGDVESAVKLFTPVSEREAFSIIRTRFMLRLVDAPFDIADAKLTKAGACTVCPNRTGNQAELFADVKSADVCTFLTCFREKRDAEWERRTTKAKESGQKVLGASETKKLFDGYGEGTELSYSAREWIDVDKSEYFGGATKSTTLREKLGDKLPQTTLVRDREGGIHELVKRAAAETKAARATPTKLSPAEKKRAAEERATKLKTNTKLAIEAKCTELALAAISEKAEGKLPTAELWRALIVAKIDDSMSENVAELLFARKLVKEVDDAHDLDTKGLVRMVSKLSEKASRGLFIDIMARESLFNVYGSRREEKDTHGAFDMLCDFYKVDPKKFQAEAKASVGAGAKS